MADKTIAQLLGEGSVSNEIASILQEAFDKKLVEAREQVEQEIREEFGKRFDFEKANLVEAMDRMLSEVVEKQECEKDEAVDELKEARNAFRKGIRESKRAYKSKLDENYAYSRKFVTEKLAAEITALREQKKALKEERLATAEKLENLKETLVTEHAIRLSKIDNFVVKQVQKELAEFQQDKRALVETRFKMVTESKAKLRATQKKFVESAAKRVESLINETLKKEMTELHEDIERNRQNTFGRRIFEAMAGEYMTSYLAEGTEVRNLQQVLEARETELAEAKAKISDVLKESQMASKKAKIAEDRAVRSKVMGELLSPLRGDKKMTMEGMLDSVKTEALRETFTKLLPMVLEGTPRKTDRKVLNETQRSTPRVTTTVTGENRSASRLFENARSENQELDNELAQIIHLAGINR